MEPPCFASPRRTMKQDSPIRLACIPRHIFCATSRLKTRVIHLGGGLMNALFLVNVQRMWRGSVAISVCKVSCDDLVFSNCLRVSIQTRQSCARSSCVQAHMKLLFLLAKFMEEVPVAVTRCEDVAQSHEEFDQPQVQQSWSLKHHTSSCLFLCGRRILHPHRLKPPESAISRPGEFAQGSRSSCRLVCECSGEC